MTATQRTVVEQVIARSELRSRKRRPGRHLGVGSQASAPVQRAQTILSAPGESGRSLLIPS